MTNEISRSEEARRAEVLAERKKPVVAVAERRAFAARLQQQALAPSARRLSGPLVTSLPLAATRLTKPLRPPLPQGLALASQPQTEAPTEGSKPRAVESPNVAVEDLDPAQTADRAARGHAERSATTRDEPDVREASRSRAKPPGDAQPDLLALLQSLPRGTPTPTASAIGFARRLAPEALQGLVEYAAVVRDREGSVGFKIAFDRKRSSGMVLQLRMLGRGEVAIRAASDEPEQLEGELAGLVDLLRSQGLTVADIERA